MIDLNHVMELLLSVTFKMIPYFIGFILGFYTKYFLEI